VTPTTVHILTSRKITVGGAYWPPNSNITIQFIELGVVTSQLTTETVGSSGSFSWTGNIPSSALPGTATIKVCVSGTSNCMTKTITVTT
jgi:hypothetical protein